MTNRQETAIARAALTWIFAKVYVFERSDAFDWLLRFKVPALVDSLNCERWFFTRYVDDTGLHLRIRFEVDARSCAESKQTIVRALELEFDALERFRDQRWYLPKSAADPAVFGSLVEPRRTTVVFEPHRPEVSFCGPAANDIVESLFSYSSRLAVDVLDRLDDRTLERSIALGLMHATAAALVPAAERRGFWVEYRDFWTRSVPSAGWIAALFKKATSMDVRAVNDELRALEPECRGYAVALDIAREELNRTEPAFLAQRASLQQVIHLMNNRLGLSPLEEAYLAEILQLAHAAET